MDLKEKVIVVTGGGSGIGRALVLALVGRGAKVAAVDRQQDGLEGTKALLDENQKECISLHVTDITDRAAVEALPEQVKKNFGQIDGLINNAGIIQPFVKVSDLSYDAIKNVMNVNFYGTLHMIKAFLPDLKSKQEAYLLNVSSMGGFLPVPGQSVYGASKAAVKLLSEALMSELDDTGVHVSVVFPGAVATNITENSGVDTPSGAKGKEQDFKPLPAEQAANIILKGMQKNKKRIYVGKDSKMMNFLYRLAPGYATSMISRQMKSLLQ